MPIGDGQVMGRIRSFLTEPTFANVSGMTPEDVDRRRALAQALWSEGNSSRPVVGVLDGMNRVLQSYLGGKGMWRAENTDIAVRERDRATAAAEEARRQQEQTDAIRQMNNFANPAQPAPQAPADTILPATTFNAGSQNEWSAGDFPGGGTVPHGPQITYNYGDSTIRNLPINSNLENVLKAAADAAGVSSIVITSGGQPSASEGGNRIGATNHDHGGAADLQLIGADGRMLDFTNPADLPIIQAFVSYAHANGATGIGAGTDYMGNNTLHVGFGAEGVWGGTGENAPPPPDWLTTAFNATVPGTNAMRNFVDTAASDPVLRPFLAELLQGQITALMTPPEPGDGYTLGANETRFDANNQPVARGAGTATAEPTTADITNWQRAKADDGYTGTLQEWISSNRTPLVTVDQRGENAFAGAMGTGLANDVFLPMVTNGVQANQDLYLINRLDDLLGETGGGLGTVIAQAAGNLGIPTGTTDAIQGAQAIIDYMVPRMRAPGSGSTSNFDAQTFRRSLPALMNQPGGNDIIIGTLRGMAEYQIAAGDVAMQVATGRLTPQEGLDQIGALPDPFAAFKATGLAETPAAAPSAAPPAAAAVPGTGNTMEQRLTPQTAPSAIPPPPAGIDPGEWPALWQNMTPADRALFQ